MTDVLQQPSFEVVIKQEGEEACAVALFRQSQHIFIGVAAIPDPTAAPHLATLLTECAAILRGAEWSDSLDPRIDLDGGGETGDTQIPF